MTLSLDFPVVTVDLIARLYATCLSAFLVTARLEVRRSRIICPELRDPVPAAVGRECEFCEAAPVIVPRDAAKVASPPG